MDPIVQKRIYPELRIQQRQVIARILGVLFSLIGLGLVIGNAILAVGEHDSSRLLYALFGLIFGYVGLYAAGLNLWEWLVALLHRRVWQRQQITADGEIVDRAVRRQVDDEGNVSHRYWITVRFDSVEGPVVLRAQVDRSYYLWVGSTDTIAVRYALENPRLALLEGEWED
jgi:hypothetical protein